jgi:hypothetical protein
VADFVFHLPRSWLGPFGTGLLPFYQKLIGGLEAANYTCETIALDRDTALDRVNADTAFHVINHGRIKHPRVLNAGIAYVYPFWNMDPNGIRAFSSIADQTFRAADVDADLARPFFRRIKQRLVGGRTSRYEQPEQATELPDGAVAVFLQSEGHRIVGETCYLDRWHMVETVLANVEGPVVMKPHPRDIAPETAARLQKLQSQHANLTISDGNIHDILSAASRVVTINSAVGIEAYLHRKPVILCGQADFHHIADIAHDQGELAAFLAAPIRARAYDKYVYWYFGLQCLSTVQPNLVAAFLDKARAQGHQV